MDRIWWKSDWSTKLGQFYTILAFGWVTGASMLVQEIPQIFLTHVLHKTNTNTLQQSWEHKYACPVHIHSVLSTEWQILHDCVIIVACFTSYQSGVQFFCQVPNLLANRTLASMSGSVSDTTGVSPRNFVVVLGILSWITWIQCVLWWNIHAHHNL